MYYANGKNGIRVSIDFAEKGQPYCCPYCGGALIVKRGEKIPAYFSHKPNADCDIYYSRNAGMGIWHKRMQEMFPEDCREIVVHSDDKSKIRIADVLVGCYAKNIIIEFQQSKISSREFRERTLFFLNNNRKESFGDRKLNKVIWVFNFSDKNIHFELANNSNYVHAQWRGPNCIRFLNNTCSTENLRILFFVSKNQFVSESNIDRKLKSVIEPNALIDVKKVSESYRSFSGELIKVADLPNYIYMPSQ